MGKRKIIEAAKKKGLTVVAAEWAMPNQVLRKEWPTWQVLFGGEIESIYGQSDIQSFTHTAEALEWIDSLEPLPPREEEE